MFGVCMHTYIYIYTCIRIHMLYVCFMYAYVCYMYVMCMLCVCYMYVMCMLCVCYMYVCIYVYRLAGGPILEHMFES